MDNGMGPPWLRSVDIGLPDLGSIDQEAAIAQRLKTALGELLKENYERYHELIMAVQTKFPGETRHQTALRYILEREKQTGNAAKETK